MDSVKTIKGIDRETWLMFKEIAAKKGMKMGDLLASMIKEYERNAEEKWNLILNSGKILSDKEAEDMLKIVKKLRKERGFRDVSDF